MSVWLTEQSVRDPTAANMPEACWPELVRTKVLLPAERQV
jgi:hypothetical protein